jgi:ribosomal protein S18 acetylase RimI-like enzyme
VQETRLRRARAEDAKSIAAIWLAGWRESHLGHVPEALVAARTPASFSSRAAQRIDDTTVACVGDAIAGFVMMAGDEVEQVYVDSAYRGTDIASLLLDEAQRLVAAAGHPRAWLAVIASNARARRFYERRGWTDEGAFNYPAKTEGGPVLLPCHRYVREV